MLKGDFVSIEVKAAYLTQLGVECNCYCGAFGIQLRLKLSNGSASRQTRVSTLVNHISVAEMPYPDGANDTTITNCTRGIDQEALDGSLTKKFLINYQIDVIKIC